MGLKAGQQFINLPVKDLKQSVAFFKMIGFEFQSQFTSEKTACMILNKNHFVLLIEEEYYRTLAKTEEVLNTTEVLSLSAESREKVDDLVAHALAAGATPTAEPFDNGMIYQWGFQDLDGHHWEVAHLFNHTIQ